MFTGIIEETGTIKSIKTGSRSVQLTVAGKKIFDDLNLGDSVATNGICLTVTTLGKDYFTADVMHETLNRTNLGQLKSGSKVNLERAMAANGRFGGHIVSGHVDGTGTVTSHKKDDIALWYTIKTSPQIMRYIIEKGSITIDGISLTVAKTTRDSFSVSIIPHTAQNTTLLEKCVGSIVNLENDIVGKYIEKFVSPQEKITKDFLLKNGF